MVITSEKLDLLNSVLLFGMQATINFIASEQVVIVGYCDAVQFNPPVILPQHKEDKGVVDIYNVCNIVKYRGICTALIYFFLSKLDLSNYKIYLGVKVFEDDNITINKHSIGAIKCYTGLGFILIDNRNNKSLIGQDFRFRNLPIYIRPYL